MTPVLEFENIARSYKRGSPVLNGVSFSVSEGEVVGLLGRNGSGKTTLIRIAMGLLFPHAGSVHAFGISPTKNPVAVKLRVGYVAEDQVLPGGASVAELIAFHRYLFPNWDAALERQLLDRFGLQAGAKIKHLSKGEARQAALLLAVCHRPELLILDEPAGGLDAAARREFLETSIMLLNREGTAILFSSHYMADVERIGGRAVLLDGGKVRLDRDLIDLRERICLAMIPQTSAPDAAPIERTPGCLRVHAVGDQWHAVFEGAPDEVRRQLAGSMGTNGVRCLPLSLEELFIELLGGRKGEHS
ncbi:MAG: ABC transporter ATP-binding protein [Bryobacteraceae bacterium]|jgi:ABC-2 type transport system ATP-binding protein